MNEEMDIDQKIVAYKWIFKIKTRESNAENKRCKARLMTKGFTQKEGVDYNEIFCPIANYTSILTADFNSELDQFNVKTSFLNCDLDEIIYMNQPVGSKGK